MLKSAELQALPHLSEYTKTASIVKAVPARQWNGPGHPSVVEDRFTG